MIKTPTIKILENVFNDVFENANSVNIPRAIFIAGQPGAGKGGVVDDLMKREKGNFVIINTDDLRKYHPLYDKIMSENPEDVYPKLNPFANILADKIYKKAIEEKKQIIFDGTFGSGYEWQKNNYIKTLKNNKYKIELAALSANSIISTIGINYRPAYLSSIDVSKNYRPVPFNVHNQIFDLIPKNINDAVKNKLFDKFYLYRRNNLKFGAIQVKSYNKLFGNFFIKDFNTERYRKLMPNEKLNLNEFFKKTLKFLKIRNGKGSIKEKQFLTEMNEAKLFFTKNKNLTRKYKKIKL